MLKYILMAVLAVITYNIETLFPFLIPQVYYLVLTKILQESIPVSGSLYGICAPIEQLRGLNTKIYPVL